MIVHVYVMIVYVHVEQNYMEIILNSIYITFTNKQIDTLVTNLILPLI